MSSPRVILDLIELSIPIKGNGDGCTWLPAKKLLNAHVHRWAETPVGRQKERERPGVWGGGRDTSGQTERERDGGGEVGRCFID